MEAQDGEKTVKIEVDAQGGIKIESTEKKNGKDVTEKFAAKDLDDLKKNQPKGHEIYQQYERYLNRVGAIREALGELVALQAGPPDRAMPKPGHGGADDREPGTDLGRFDG